jgi:trehalose 6-phosphate synthase
MTLSELPKLILPTVRTTDRHGVHHMILLEGDPAQRPEGSENTPSDVLHEVLRERNGIRITVGDAETVEVLASVGSAPSSAVDSLTIPITSAELSDYDAGMSNATLWRLFHGVPVQPEFSPDWWTSYVAVNRRLADAASQAAAHGATVWIRGHHLLLVPAMLRSLRPDLALGYTSRIPFPPPDLFARLPWKRDLLDGLASADLVGLPRREDVLNFLRAVRRFATDTIASPPGNDPKDDNPATQLLSQPVLMDLTSAGWLETQPLESTPGPEHARRSQQLRSSLGNPKTLLLGIDPLDPTRGIPRRLDAISALLEDGRLDPTTTVYVQATFSSPHDPQDDLRHAVETGVARINGRFASIGNPVIHHLHRPLPPDELIALYLAADVLVSTPLSEDLSPAVPQYVAARTRGQGGLILSEFSGYATLFPQAQVVNPYDAQALEQAIACGAHPGDATPRAPRPAQLTATASRQVTHDFLDTVAKARAARPIVATT